MVQPKTKKQEQNFSSAMSKAYFCNFLPSKAEEKAAATSKANNTIFQVGRALVEIRDLYPIPAANVWQIKKVATSTDILTGKLMLLHYDVFEYIFRHWSLEMCSQVVAGNKVYAVIWDLTDESCPVRYHSENIYLERGPQDTSLLGWTDLARKAKMNPNDEIGLHWEIRCETFQFKVLHRRI